MTSTGLVIKIGSLLLFSLLVPSFPYCAYTLHLWCPRACSLLVVVMLRRDGGQNQTAGECVARRETATSILRSHLFFTSHLVFLFLSRFFPTCALVSALRSPRYIRSIVGA